MFDTTVVRPGKADRHVKNLGWLLRHWKEVEAFTLAKMPRGHAWDGYMVAHLSDGGEFRTRWASVEVMLRWLRRTTFAGSPGTSPDELITLTLTADAEDIPVRGNATASGDDAADKKYEDGIIARLESGDEWAWCYAALEATCGDYSAHDGLGCCCYTDAADFMSPGGYFDDMVRIVLGEIRTARVAALAQ
jgi:hypothetical protein